MNILYFNIALIFILFFLLLIFSITNRKYNKLLQDMNKISIAIKRIRYGDIYIRVKKLNNQDIEAALNRLIETIYDREMMIKEYQTTLSKKNLSLEEILKQEKQLQLFKEEFAATLTHDMKVPVIAELNSIDYLLEGRFGSLTEKQTEILYLMKSSNIELKELIENMLEIYRLEQTEIKLNKKKHNFNDFINNILKEMYSIINEKEHSITCELKETENINISFDFLQLTRVIKNLIQNAITHSPNKSEIKIITSVVEDKIKFTISNPAFGMSKEKLEQIFDKYYSLHSKFKKTGTGLGLYLSQQIALAHQGKIEAQQIDNEKIFFTLTLPIKD